MHIVNKTIVEGVSFNFSPSKVIKIIMNSSLTHKCEKVIIMLVVIGFIKFKQLL